jgi:solute carrier family 10 (sodium/bile acid cotransporter), member 7
MQFLKRNWFPIALVLSFIAGYFFRDVGVALNPDSFGTYTVVIVIFLITGYTMPTEALVRGVTDLKLHLYMEIFIFVVFPLYVLVSTLLLGDLFRPEVVAGLFALAVLPTTITSCTVFTQATNGNVAGTMFNAAFSNLVGVFLSPLLLSLMLQSTGRALPMDQLTGIFIRLGILMIIPIAIGQIMRRVYPAFSEKHGPVLRKSTSIAILLVVFFNVAAAAVDEAFMANLGTMGGPTVYLIISHLLLLALAWGGAKLFRLGRANEMSVIFTAPHKTLALGAPLVAIYFADRPEVIGIALLPVILYHLVELLVAGVLRSRLVAP